MFKDNYIDGLINVKMLLFVDMRFKKKQLRNTSWYFCILCYDYFFCNFNSSFVCVEFLIDLIKKYHLSQQKDRQFLLSSIIHVLLFLWRTIWMLLHVYHQWIKHDPAVISMSIIILCVYNLIFFHFCVILSVLYA